MELPTEQDRELWRKATQTPDQISVEAHLPPTRRLRYASSQRTANHWNDTLRVGEQISHESRVNDLRTI